LPQLKPFRALLYNQQTVALSAVVAPPYDVISPELQDELYANSPYNIVRLDLGREADRYGSAARLLGEWQADRVLEQDDVPAMYVLVQDFSSPEGKEMRRLGFIALCKLEELGKGSILPHEKTLSKPKEDRLRLLQAARAHFSQIFCMYDDPQRRIEKRTERHLRSVQPVVDVTFDGVRNRLWRISEEGLITAFQEAVQAKKVYVADGHHRYETALEFRSLMQNENPNHTGEEPYNFIMMYFTNMRDKGLTILPTHRLVLDLPSFDAKHLLQQLSLYFRVTKQSGLAELVAALKRKERFAFGLAVADEPRYHFLSVVSMSHLGSIVPARVPEVVRGLDVTILHAAVIEKILGIPFELQKQKAHLEYVADVHEADDAVKQGKAQAAFLMNPTRIAQVRSVAEAGKTMPQKSTYFYPKLLSGLVIHSLDRD